MSFELPDMPYAYDALEPHIDALTMEIHYSKHHNAYTNNLNAAVEGNGLEGKTIEELLSEHSDIAAVRNNGGGWWNHCQFWEAMSPSGGGAPSGELAVAIDSSFGSFDEFKSIFHNAAMTQFGSGWAWLSIDGSNKLIVSSTSNQDNPISDGLRPILGLDVWEHAYYLNYQNLRPDYIAAWWNTVNWDKVSERFAK